MTCRLGGGSVVLGVAAACPRPLAAQGVVSLRGRVMDGTTAAPLVGAAVMVAPGRRPGDVRELAETDRAGRYEVAGLAPGERRVAFICPGRASAFRRFAERRVRLAAGDARALDLRLPPGLCAAPPPAARPGVYRGHYTRGFETSFFLPCRDPGIPGRLIGWQRDSAGFHGTYAWVPSWGNDRTGVVRYPAVPDSAGGARVWFVRWRGTLAGPARDGHEGLAEYEFAVDTVLEARAPGPGDCGPASTRPSL